MVKRGKKSSKKVPEKERKESSKKGKDKSSKEIQDLLIENFVGLQKAMTNVSIKFGELSSQINQLLEIFELSAKKIVNSGGKSGALDLDVLRKIDTLLEQNKAIASGIIMLEERVRNQKSGQQNQQSGQPPQPPIQRIQQPNKNNPQQNPNQSRTLPRI